MKKFIKLIILVVVFTIIGGINAEAAKKITTNRNNVSMKVGETKKIKVNVKNVKVKSSKIVKVTVKGKVVSVKGVKAGKSKVKFTAKKMKSKTVKITVKKVRILKAKKVQSKKNKKMTEKDVREKIDGYGDKYKDNIESYPYLDKKSYNKISDPDKLIQRNVWKNMPDYLRDCIVYNKTEIRYSDDLSKYKIAGYTTEGVTSGCDMITLKYESGDINEHLIHEAAHVYDYFNQDFGVDVKNKIKNEYNNYPKKYGNYGSSNLAEFYAEKTERECLKNVKLIPDEIEIKEYENHKVEDLGNGKVKIILNESEYYAPTIIINGIWYINGMEKNEYVNYYREMRKQYFDKLYDNYTFE